MNTTTTCKNCGGDLSLHHYMTSECPVGGVEAPLGEPQRWMTTVYEPASSSLVALDDIPLTKAAIEATGQQAAQQLLDAGEQSPLAALIQLRALRDAIDHAIKGLEDAAMDEAGRYGRHDANWRGVGFTVRNGRTVYDYSHDATWAEMKAQETAVAEQRKAREKFLQALPGEMVDPDTGEFITPATIKNVTSSVLALTFPKE